MMTTLPPAPPAASSAAAGGGAPAVYNAANEVAVASFLAHQIPFLAIPRVVEHTLGQLSRSAPADLPAILALDQEARRLAKSEIENRESRI